MEPAEGRTGGTIHQHPITPVAERRTVDDSAVEFIDLQAIIGIILRRHVVEDHGYPASGKHPSGPFSR